jgi:chloramphenicol 3-O phosphotransferase
MRPRFFDGFHRCIPGLAAAGYNVLVEHVVEHHSWRVQLDQLLTGYDVFWVGLDCDLAEIDRREIARGDRVPGEGQAHVEQDRIHDHGPYDLRIDTTGGVTDITARTVIDAWATRLIARAGHRGSDGRPIALIDPSQAPDWRRGSPGPTGPHAADITGLACPM